MIDHPVQRWRFRLPKERRVSARRPVIAGNVVYVAFWYDKGGLVESTLFALDADSGVQRWSYRIDHVGNEPVVADDIVYWSSFEGAVHAIDREGRLLWKAPCTDASIGVPVISVGNRLFVAEISGGARWTWCLDRATGATLWRFEHGGHTYRLCHSGDRVYHTSVASAGIDESVWCSLHCLYAVDGSVQWSVSGPDYLFSPIVIDDRVHVCSHRSLYIHSAADGHRVSEEALGSDGETVTLAPGSWPAQTVVWGSRAAEGGDWIAAYTVDPVRRWFGGSRPQVRWLWRFKEPRRVCDAPLALPGGRLVYLTHDGTVQMIAGETGEPVLKLTQKTQSSEFGGLAIGNDILVAAHGRDVVLFAFSG